MPVVHDSIRTNSNLDVYPTHEAKLGKGGYRTVANIAERDNITYERCEEGMLVTVLEDDTNNNKTTTYILKQNTRDSRTWEKFNNGAVDANLTNRVTALETSSAKVDNEIATLNSEISTKVSLNEHNNLVASLSTYALKSDLNTLATKDELNDKLDVSTYTTDKDTFATKDELNNKADLSSLDTLTTKDELKTLVYTKSQVDEKIADAVTGGSINLDGYVKKDEIVNLATKDEVNAKLDISTYTTDKDTFATKDELNNKADLSSLDDLATKTELSSLATKAELNAKLDVSTYTADKDTFATKTQLEGKANKDEVYSKTEIDTNYTTTEQLNLALSNKADKSTIDSLATKVEVNEEIAKLATKEELASSLATKADSSIIPTLATKTELNNKADRSDLDTKANSSDLQNLATKEKVNEINSTLTNAINTKANADAVVNLTGEQTIEGVKTFTSNIESPNITAIQNNLNTIFSSTTSPVRYQNGIKEITVGTGGNFQTIQEAIQEASKYNSDVLIKLVSNISINKDISLSKLDLKHVSIYFNNFKIINSTNSVLSFSLNNCFLSDIKDLNIENIRLYLKNNSSLIIWGSANINCENMNSHCVLVGYSSSLSLGSCNIKHFAGRIAFAAFDGSSINIANKVTINDSSASGKVLDVTSGSIIYATGATINTSITKANQAANTITANGIIFGNYSL